MTQGDHIQTGNITDSVVAIGRNAEATFNQYIYSANEIEMLDFAEIQSYLERVSQPYVPPSNTSEEMQRFYNVPFHTHQPGEISIDRADLWTSVKGWLEQQRKFDHLQRLMILAEAGMGKTPALEYLQTRRAKLSLANYRSHQTRVEQDPTDFSTSHTFIIPFMIDLGALLHSDLDFVDLICDAFNRSLSRSVRNEMGERSTSIPFGQEHRPISNAQTMGLLQEYTCLFLLDGLDVLISNGDQRCIQIVRHFMALHKKDQFIISSRTATYRGQLGTLDILMLDDLNLEEVERILGETRYKRLNRTLRQLARNRTMLESVLKLDKRAISLMSKGQLHQKLIRLDFAEQGSDKWKVNADMVEDLLEQLAYVMLVDRVQSYTEPQVMQIVKKYLQEWDEPYNWRFVLSELRNIGLLQREVNRHWKFAKRTTAAYFAAIAIAQEPQKRLAPLLPHIDDPALLEVLELLVGLLRNPSPFFQTLLDKNHILLASYCLQFTSKPLDSRMNEALTDALIERMQSEHTDGRLKLVLQLGESGHPRALEALMRALRQEKSSMVVLTIVRSIWVCISKNSTIPWKEIDEKVAQSQPQGDTHMAPLAELLDIYKNAFTSSPEIRHTYIQHLTDILKQEDEPLPRGLVAIGLGFIGNDVAREALLDTFFQDDVDPFVGWCSAEGLAQIDHSEVHEKILIICEAKKYREPKWRDHRARALYLLGWVGQLSKRHRTKIDRLLLEALDDPYIPIRGFAVQSIGRLDIRAARESIEKMLPNEHHTWLRRKLAQTLGKIGNQESIEILKQEKRLEMARTRTLRNAITEIDRRDPLDEGMPSPYQM